MANAIRASLLRAKALYTGFVAGAPAVDDSTVEVNADVLRVKDAGITLAKLGSNVTPVLHTKGHIPLDLGRAFIIATNDTATTTEGGLPDNNTAPSLKRINTSTDKNGRLAWAASSVAEVQWIGVPKPYDLDETAAIVVHLLAGMSGASDTPVIGVSYFEGVGDTNAGGNTAALDSTAGGKHVTVSIAAADVAAYPGTFSVGLTPAAHGTDALYLYGAWIEYTRKDS